MYQINQNCIVCGNCIAECPVGAIKEGDHYSIDTD
ncbi:4Fe-4S binding protein, partial [Bacteroides congonensis]